MAEIHRYSQCEHSPMIYTFWVDDLSAMHIWWAENIDCCWENVLCLAAPDCNWTLWNHYCRMCASQHHLSRQCRRRRPHRHCCRTPLTNSSMHRMSPSSNYYLNSLDLHKNHWPCQCWSSMCNSWPHMRRARRYFHFSCANAPVWNTVAFATMYRQFFDHYPRSKCEIARKISDKPNWPAAKTYAPNWAKCHTHTLDLEHEFNRITFDEWRSFSPNILSNGEPINTGCLRYCTIEMKRIDRLSFASPSIRLLLLLIFSVWPLIACSNEFLWHSCVNNNKNDLKKRKLVHAVRQHHGLTFLFTCSMFVCFFFPFSIITEVYSWFRIRAVVPKQYKNRPIYS